MMVLLMLLSFSVFASEPTHWSHLLEVSERHEFYQNKELITKPKNSWQMLFGLVYLDRNLVRLKDCIFYHVPGIENGILKIKTISALDKCEEFILKDGDIEIKNIKSLEFTLLENHLKIYLSYTDFRSEKWSAKFQSSYDKPQTGMNLSSAEFKSPKIIMLAPVSNPDLAKKNSFLKYGSLCHDVNEDCEVVKTSICNRCEYGWYEVPNGCPQGPKYCGNHKCGGKGEPACRRGGKWQRKTEEFDCRVNSSFAYCSKGHKVRCEGQKAFCL
jgi:hypothetical protein